MTSHELPPLFALAQLGEAADPGAVAHYADVAYYEKAYRSRAHDVAFYLDRAAGVRGPVLEYGAGSGRITLPLARAGHEVTAVDLARPMLARLREALGAEPEEVRKRVGVRRGDMRSVRLTRTYPLVIAGFNTFLHLYSRRDVERFLARVRAHLTAKGRLVFDYSMPRPADLALQPGRAYAGVRLRDPASGKLVKYTERFEYDAFRQIQLCNMCFQPIEEGAPWSIPLTHRQFFPQEIEALLHYNGFRDIRFFGDFSDDGPDADTDWLVVDCRRT